MKLVLDDNGYWKRFAPLCLTRPIGDLRMGILTNAERWRKANAAIEIYYKTESYLAEKFPSCETAFVTVNACLIPDSRIINAILNLSENESLTYKGEWLAKKGNGDFKIEWEQTQPLIISQRWHLFQFNHLALMSDFELLTSGRVSRKLDESNTLIGDLSQLFLEDGATVQASILNTTNGPIYISKGAEIMEGSIVRGGLAMLPGSALKLGTKVYGATTLGPQCKVGGEVNNVIFQAFSNKGHDGFLGNALIGEWCNLGADTNSSNLKNNYGNVSTYSYETKGETQTDVQFMGLCMGDHSKCGINTMFNTASVVGVSCNVFGAEFPPKYFPSFSWGGVQFTDFKFDKAIEYANNMMNRRDLSLSEAEIAILRYIADNK